MRRREFIEGLGGAATWPLVARGQQDLRTRRVGSLVPSEEPHTAIGASLCLPSRVL
jgi:hypothetical protein